MSVKGTAQAKAIRVTSAGRLTLLGVAELKDELREALGSGSRIVIEMSDDELIDVAGAQVLISALVSSGRQKQSVELPDPLPTPVATWAEHAGIVFDQASDGVQHE